MGTLIETSRYSTLREDQMKKDRISMIEFQKWWDEEGSAIKPKEGEDLEEFLHRVCFIAWDNGAYKKAVQLGDKK